jgi:hypothetical protein
MESRLLKRGETSGRSDDNAETIRKRFKTFVDQSLPVIDHYAAIGKAHKISATSPPEEVFVHVQKAIEQSALPAPAAAANGKAANGKAAGKAKPAAKASRKELKGKKAEGEVIMGTPVLAMA